MKIAIASMGDPRSVGTWSGIPSHIYYALQVRGHDLSAIALNPPKEPWHYDWKRRIHYHLQKRWFLSSVDKVWLRKVGQQLDREVNRIQPDVVLVFHGDFLAHITFRQPVCFIHDATWATLVNYYSSFTSLTAASIKAGHAMYQQALNRADAAIFSSAWASNSAIHDYKATEGKVYTIPLGANIKSEPHPDDVKQWIGKRVGSENCNLLFLGYDWERKGGADALRFVAELNRLGLKSSLTIAGCLPQIPKHLEEYVRIIGFLRKDVESEAVMLEELLQQSHALLLPSVAECYGCVYCEANAYGLPALGRDTGGVSEIIKEGVNGLLQKTGESPEQFANRWAKIWDNKSDYVQLSSNSRKEFEERLNYNVFAEKLEDVLINIKRTK